MKKETFAFIRDLLYRVTGNVLEDGKEYLIDLRLDPLMKELKLDSVDSLIERIRNQPYHPLVDRIIDAMMNNETTFFRDRLPYDALKSAIIPELIERRGSERTLTIWSNACSSGQEPYSIAMLLLEEFPRLAGWDIKIYGSDVSGEMVRRAGVGNYNQIEINRGLPVGYLMKYFDRDGLIWNIRTDVRRLVTFQQINLTGSWPLLPTFDIVFMRYVMIYFDVDLKKGVLGRVRRQMRPDGYLFLGGTETTLNLDNQFGRAQAAGTVFYRIKSE